jgi:hypothetical protein
MKVQTRREAVILMTAIPLLSTDAVAQPDRLDALFDPQSLLVPSRVRQRYAILAYYIQLLNLQRPMRSRSEDIAAGILAIRGRTLGLLETGWDRPKIARC